jgi:hypothetical protein
MYMSQEAKKASRSHEALGVKQEEASTVNKEKLSDFNFFVSDAERGEASTKKETEEAKKGEEKKDKSISFFLPE